MYISEIKIENFRLFGTGQNAFTLSLNPGLTAFVGENDSGKTAVIDALRLILGTRDQDRVKLESSDFHFAPQGRRAGEMNITLTFSGLTPSDRKCFAEYLSYGTNGNETQLILNWNAKRAERTKSSRLFFPLEWRTGRNGDGPHLDANKRFLLQATYLRPLRDAEREMSSGRGSRLSQILQHTEDIKNNGINFDPSNLEKIDPNSLSILGIGDYSNHLIESAPGIKRTKDKLNSEYITPLSFQGDKVGAHIRINGSADDSVRLRQLLEKLELNLKIDVSNEELDLKGLGSNNMLFMACELLLMKSESEGFPLLLIEEPEAHLHPQRQVRLMTFLQNQISQARGDGQKLQIFVTTHSPNLASQIPLNNLVLMSDGKPFPMRTEETKLSNSDYRFLERFLDSTKANLFFARGVAIVEGDAENILLPVLAKLIGRGFDKYGVSIVNVGGVGLSRYGRVFMRSTPTSDNQLGIPVACITDLDIMPNCAPVLLQKIKEGEPIPSLGPPDSSKRRWRVKSDYSSSSELETKRQEIRDKAHEQQVKSFVAGEWTLEYDLAYSGLSWELFLATSYAKEDDKINEQKTDLSTVYKEACVEFDCLKLKHTSTEELCTAIYAPLTGSNPISKTITAQYLAEILSASVNRNSLTAEQLRQKIPSYIVEAIEHVTEPFIRP